MTMPMNALATPLRFLCADAIEHAKSGHPGMPLGMADVVTVLFRDFVRFSPKDPKWPNRDRFVLSAGHGAALQYALLHLLGVEEVDREALKALRRLHNITPGHPEFGLTPGVEATTGPLGQGLAMGVGMALAARKMQAHFGKAVFDYHTYVVVGDGCLMEGISQEAISFAGHQRLNQLIVLFDDNGISIDGPTSLTTNEDHQKRFEACGWAVLKADGHDESAIQQALKVAHGHDVPTMIMFKTDIGKGAPAKAGSSKVHGSPLGADEIAAMRKAYNWPYPPFEMPEEALSAWRDVGYKGDQMATAWHEAINAMPAADKARMEKWYVKAKPLFQAENQHKLLANARAYLAECGAEATRQSSQAVIEMLQPVLPGFVGGSADLTPSNNTRTAEMKTLTPESPDGNYIHYGIREHGMAAMMNGMALSNCLIPYGGTFLTFSDYCRPAMRLSALMEQQVIYVMTHDSIGLGEDGPTHQPVEHLMSLRLIPNLHVFRPADFVETFEAWLCALHFEKTPSVLALSRQKLPQVSTLTPENKSMKGGYILEDVAECNVVLVASGSEVHLALEVKEALAQQHIKARVVSMPCITLFAQQDASYRADVLTDSCPIFAIEAGQPIGWEGYLGRSVQTIGMTTFGASGPAADLFKKYGFSVEAITQKIYDYLQ